MTTNLLDQVWSQAEPQPEVQQTAPINPLDKIFQQTQAAAQAPAGAIVAPVAPAAAAPANPLDQIWNKPQPKPASIDMTQPDSTWDKVKSFLTHPLVSSDMYLPGVSDIEDASKFAANELQQSGHTTLAQVASAPAGVAQGVKDTLSGMTSPLNLGIVGATGGLGATEDAAVAGLAKLGLSDAVAAAIPKLVNMGFALTGIYSAAKNVPAIQSAIQKGDVENAARLIAGTSGTVAMSGYAGLHALGEINPEINNAPAAKIVQSDAAKLAATDTTPAVAKTAPNPVDAAFSPEAKTAEGQQVPIATVVSDEHVPVVSKDAILSEATQRIINNSPIIQQIIDPAKIQTPADIQTALDAASDHIEKNLDPRVGARISFNEQKQLASDLGMSVEELLERKSGTAFNAEQAIAARSMLQTSANSIVDFAKQAAQGNDDARGQLALAIATHQEIQNQIAGVASEAGRSLGSFRIDDTSLPQVKIAKAMAQLKPEALDEAAKLLAKMDPSSPDYPQRVNAFVREIKPSTTGDKLFEVYRNNLLSSPATVIKKSASEVTMLALEAMKKSAVGGLESLKSATGISDNSEAFASEGYWYARGAAQALTHAKEILSGEFNLADSPMFEGNGSSAIKGTLGQIARAPSTLLERQTNLMFAMNYYGSLQADAARAAIQEGLSGEDLASRQDFLAKNPTKQMIADANELGLHNTFQSKLGKIAGPLSQTISSNPITRFVFPFFKTPINLVKAAGEYSPYGLFAGTAQGDLNAQAKGLIGSSIAAGIAYLASNGDITGGGPIDFKQRETKEATGWQPYSLKIGGKYYSYHQAEPLGLVLSLVADTVHSGLRDEGAVTNSKAENAVSHITRNVQDFPFLMQLGSIVDSLTHLGNGNTAERVVDNLLASSVVPAGVKNVAETIDRTVRTPQYAGLDNPAQGISQTVQARIPGLTQNAPADIDVTGQPVKRPVSSLGGANLFPVTTGNSNRVTAELARLGITVEGLPNKPISVRGAGGKSIKLPGSQPTPAEAARLQQIEQQALYNGISGAMQSPEWSHLTDPIKKTVITKLHENIVKARLQRLEKLRQK